MNSGKGEREEGEWIGASPKRKCNLAKYIHGL